MNAKSKTNTKSLLNLLVLLIGIYIIVPQLDNFKSSFSTLAKTNLSFMAIGGALLMLSFVAASLVYLLLCRRKPKFSSTLQVQLASAFTNRLLPAGLGGMGLNVRYLIKSGLKPSAAESAALVNNTLGLVGNLLLLGFLMLFGSKINLPIPRFNFNFLWAGLLGLLLILGILMLKKLRHFIKRQLTKVFKDLVSYRKRPHRLLLALLSSMSITILYSLILLVCAKALNIQITPSQALIVLTVGTATGAVTPTPGGLIGVEAGLLASLTVLGIPQPVALVISLNYRFLTYWLPLIPGFLMFKIIQRKGLI